MSEMPTLHAHAGHVIKRSSVKRRTGREIERKRERERESADIHRAADVACLRGLRTLVDGALDATIRCEVLRLVSA